MPAPFLHSSKEEDGALSVRQALEAEIDVYLIHAGAT